MLVPDVAKPDFQGFSVFAMAQMQEAVEQLERVLKNAHKRKPTRSYLVGFINSWHRAIFPGGHPPSIVAADRLYLRVRDGNGCVPVAWVPRELSGSYTLETTY